MTRYRGYKEKPSKSGVADLFESKPYESIEIPKVYGFVDVKDLLIRKSPQGDVVHVAHKGDKLEILDTLDSKWVQVATPSGLTGVAGSQYITKEVSHAD